MTDKLSNADRAVISVMRDYPIRPGQALIFGPKCVAALSKEGAFQGKLEDKHILERWEWKGTQRP